MSKFKENLDMELSFLQSDTTADDIISRASKSKKIITFKKAVLIAASFILVLTMTFVPFRNNKSSFVIIANAEATADSATPDSGKITGDTLNTETFVEIKSDDPNLIEYNFNYILNENADPLNPAQKYLFYTFIKGMKIAIEGDDIDTVTYKMKNGSLGPCIVNKQMDMDTIISNSSKANKHYKTEFTIDYDEYEYIAFDFNPLTDYEEIKNRYNLLSTGELTQNAVINDKPVACVGMGIKEKKTLATTNEIEKLREYAKNDDMVGLYNYQNQIFKRLIDNITLDIIITKTDGKKETQTLEFLYTPDVITKDTLIAEDDFEGSFFDHLTTESTGTLSARIKK